MSRRGVLLVLAALTATSRFPPEKREEANKIQFEIARCFQSRR